MPVPPLFRAPHGPDDLLRYAWFNNDHHIQVSNTIQRTKGLSVERQVIYPLPPRESMGEWLASHQSWHAQINSILGTKAFNLLSVNFSDYSALSAWAFLHATEHLAWQTTLGVP